MKIQFKKLDQRAVTPSYAKEGDAGLDLTAISFYYEYETDTCIYGTGLAVKIPEGYVGLIFPRSSIYKKSMSLANSVGVIDSGYVGEIKFMMKRRDKYYGHIYEVGERIGQMIVIPYPKIELEEVNELPSTERGEMGFGSTDKIGYEMSETVLEGVNLFLKDGSTMFVKNNTCLRELQSKEKER